LCSGESFAGWKGCLADLVARGLRAPVLAVIDGNAGLRRAVSEVWPRAAVQRCWVHKLRNLERKAPKHALAAIRDDFHRIVYATSAEAARAAWTAFERHVGQTVPRRGDEPARGRRGAPDIFHLPESAVEDVEDHEHN
jgi:transposase-like protein